MLREDEDSLGGFEEASGPSGGVNGPAGKSSWTEAGIATDSGITERLSRCWRREAYIDREKRGYNLLPGREGMIKKLSPWRRKKKRRRRERRREEEKNWRRGVERKRSDYLAISEIVNTL